MLGSPCLAERKRENRYLCVHSHYVSRFPQFMNLNLMVLLLENKKNKFGTQAIFLT